MESFLFDDKSYIAKNVRYLVFSYIILDLCEHHERLQS